MPKIGVSKQLFQNNNVRVNAILGYTFMFPGIDVFYTDNTDESQKNEEDQKETAKQLIEDLSFNTFNIGAELEYKVSDQFLVNGEYGVRFGNATFTPNNLDFSLNGAATYSTVGFKVLF
jgi:hypothetical protein